MKFKQGDRVYADSPDFSFCPAWGTVVEADGLGRPYPYVVTIDGSIREWRFSEDELELAEP